MLPGWMLNYTRLPSAKAKDISTAELVRRAVTRELAAQIKERPELAALFKGALPTYPLASDCGGQTR